MKGAAEGWGWGGGEETDTLTHTLEPKRKGGGLMTANNKGTAGGGGSLKWRRGLFISPRLCVAGAAASW